MMDTVQFESEPPGAEAKTSNGQACRTPCALALPLNSSLTVTFTLNGYLPETESIDPVVVVGSPTQLRPNPVMVELNPAPPGSQKPVKPAPAAKKKPAPKQAAKPAARAKPAAAAQQSQPQQPAPAPMTAAPAQQQPAAPWPTTAPPQR